VRKLTETNENLTYFYESLDFLTKNAEILRNALFGLCCGFSKSRKFLIDAIKEHFYDQDKK